jgi:hypothetical protein
MMSGLQEEFADWQYTPENTRRTSIPDVNAKAWHNHSGCAWLLARYWTTQLLQLEFVNQESNCEMGPSGWMCYKNVQISAKNYHPRGWQPLPSAKSPG